MNQKEKRVKKYIIPFLCIIIFSSCGIKTENVYKSVLEPKDKYGYLLTKSTKETYKVTVEFSGESDTLQIYKSQNRVLFIRKMPCLSGFDIKNLSQSERSFPQKLETGVSYFESYGKVSLGITNQNIACDSLQVIFDKEDSILNTKSVRKGKLYSLIVSKMMIQQPCSNSYTLIYSNNEKVVINLAIIKRDGAIFLVLLAPIKKDIVVANELENIIVETPK